MAKRYNEKRRKQMEDAIERELNTGQDKIDLDGTMNNDLKAAAMGGRFLQVVMMLCYCWLLFTPNIHSEFHRGRRTTFRKENDQGGEKSRRQGCQRS